MWVQSEAPGAREDKPAEHTLAGETAMHTGNSHRDILKDALASTLTVLPALFALGLGSHRAPGTCRERASAKQSCVLSCT